MFKSIEGVYRGGKIELAEIPHNVREETFVIVTFFEYKDLGLQARGIDKTPAADLRGRLATFAEDWENPQMNIYDDYDTAKSNL
ncbi:MAG: hypothetical protein DRR19_09600 [Candidatus Parabeggiatoa sp. nov. 1]|nr:MAG: hypothetical protein DRR19_09600 [Gammaproteobacteria bacterium]